MTSVVESPVVQNPPAVAVEATLVVTADGSPVAIVHAAFVVAVAIVGDPVSTDAAGIGIPESPVAGMAPGSDCEYIGATTPLALDLFGSDPESCAVDGGPPRSDIVGLAVAVAIANSSSNAVNNVAPTLLPATDAAMAVGPPAGAAAVVAAIGVAPAEVAVVGDIGLTLVDGIAIAPGEVASVVGTSRIDPKIHMAVAE